jgi:hypothetical protein
VVEYDFNHVQNSKNMDGNNAEMSRGINVDKGLPKAFKL